MQGERFGTLYVAGKDGGEEFSDADLHLVRILATEAGIALSNARLHSAARQRRRWIDGAASITTALLAGPETGSTTTNALTVVAEKGRELAEAATGAVLLPHAEGGMEVVAISTVLSEAVRTEAYRGRIPPRSPVVHQIYAGLAVFSDDFADDPRSVSPISRHYGPTMLLPLRSSGRVLGALALCRMSGDRRFSHTERTLGTQFAAQAAVALVLADRHRDRERLAVFEDRDRIARDLHDLVIQRLFATGMLLETARRKALVPEVQEGWARRSTSWTPPSRRSERPSSRCSRDHPRPRPGCAPACCGRPARPPRRSAPGRRSGSPDRSTPGSTTRPPVSCWPHSARRWRT